MSHVLGSLFSGEQLEGLSVRAHKDTCEYTPSLAEFCCALREANWETDVSLCITETGTTHMYEPICISKGKITCFLCVFFTTRWSQNIRYLLCFPKHKHLDVRQQLCNDQLLPTNIQSYFIKFNMGPGEPLCQNKSIKKITLKQVLNIIFIKLRFQY